MGGTKKTEGNIKHEEKLTQSKWLPEDRCKSGLKTTGGKTGRD